MRRFDLLAPIMVNENKIKLNERAVILSAKAKFFEYPVGGTMEQGTLWEGRREMGQER